jgi:L-lactate dehydrogenase complex protein LldG
MSNSREEILLKLRSGRAQRKTVPFSQPEWESPVFPVPNDLLSTFCAELETVQGIVIVDNRINLIHRLKEHLQTRGLVSVFCVDNELKEILADGIPFYEGDGDAFEQMQAAITRCECLVARTGTVVVSSSHPSGRRLNVFPPVHVVWARESQLVPFAEDAIAHLTRKYEGALPSQISFITGPSRTADIEKTLVMGAHGPKELIVLVEKGC